MNQTGNIRQSSPVQAVFIVTVSVLMSSCATLLNQTHRNMTVYTTRPARIIYNDVSFRTYGNRAFLPVERKKEDLNLVVITDSLTKKIEVEPRNSFMYWSNIYCNYGIGMLVDKNNPKRYAYPRRIYINTTDTLNRYYRYGQADRTGEINLHVSLPHINSFRLAPENEGIKSNTGFWGFTAGIDYYHSKSRYISLAVSGVSDFFVPVPAAIDISGEYEIMSSLYISLSENHTIRRFTLGYGLSYAKNTWDYRYYDRFDPPPPSREPIKKSSHALGFIFPSYFQPGEHFNIGLVYRPTFYRPGVPDNFRYEHLISVDFAWKIRLRKSLQMIMD